jgi:hypothetical protein
MGCHVRSQMVYFDLCPNEERDKSHNEFDLRVQNCKIQYLINSLFYKQIQLWDELPVM